MPISSSNCWSASRWRASGLSWYSDALPERVLATGDPPVAGDGLAIGDGWAAGGCSAVPLAPIPPPAALLLAAPLGVLPPAGELISAVVPVVGGVAADGCDGLLRSDGGSSAGAVESLGRDAEPPAPLGVLDQRLSRDASPRGESVATPLEEESAAEVPPEAGGVPSVREVEGADWGRDVDGASWWAVVVVEVGRDVPQPPKSLVPNALAGGAEAESLSAGALDAVDLASSFSGG